MSGNDADLKRQSDLLIGQLIGEFQAMRQHLELSQKDAKEWREKFDKRLLPLELLVERLNTPLKAVFIIFAAILTTMGIACAHWIQRHWQ